MSPALEEIQNYLRISPRLHTAGQPLEEQFAAIQAAGCHAVINLAMEYSPDFLPDEQQIVEKLGMSYVHIPVEWEAPRPQDLEAFFEAMQRLEGKTLFIHCARNMRVSAFMYLYRVLKLGEDQLACLNDLRRIWEPNPVWQAFIQTYIPQPPAGR